jgi:hypothetical protein
MQVRESEEVVRMSDAVDVVTGGIFTGGLPVYTIVRETSEGGFKKLGFSDGEAKVAARITGAWASVITVCFTGCP